MICVVALGAVVWIACGVLAYGIEFAYWQRKYAILAERDYRRDMATSIAMAPLGPFSLAINLLIFGTKYGVKFR